MKCSTCDGYGWLDKEDIREESELQLFGYDADLFWFRSFGDNKFHYALCTDCDGFGEESDEDYAEDLAIMGMIEKYCSRKGFYRYYSIDVAKRKVTTGIEFAWNERTFKLIKGLPSFSKHAKIWNWK